MTTPALIYIMDSNTLIGFHLWNPIGLSISKPFWDKLEKALQDGKWILSEVVFDEITHPRELKDWCKKQKNASLVTPLTSKDKLDALTINITYPMVDPISFNSSGDPLIIAQAKNNGYGIFTREFPMKQGDTRYKIPDTCNALGVKLVARPEVFLRGIGF